jgi:hypothetical protein
MPAILPWGRLLDVSHLPLGVGSRGWLLGVDAGVVPSVGGPMRATGRGLVIAGLGASGLPAFFVDDLFAFTDTFNVRGSFPFSHNDASFPSSSCRLSTRG